ncbi:MAG: hypothetical protein ACI4O6_09660 [Dysosmobacter sp.]
MKKKTIALVLACVICVGIGIGGTLAWLTAQTGPVTNTFTTSDISVTLSESTGLDLKMIPGHTITKDPQVTVADSSEDCWLFVKIDKSSNYSTYLADYVVADGWELVETDVYGRKVMKADTTKTFHVLKDDKVAVLESVDKAAMTAANTTPPTLTFTAYATQLYKDNTTQFSAADAWAKVNPAASGT